MAENITVGPQTFNWSVKLRLNPRINQVLQVLTSPFRPSNAVPEWVWKRLPIVGTFPVKVAPGKTFLYHSIGESIGKTLYWKGVWMFENGMPALFAELAKSANTFMDIGSYVGFYTLLAKTIHPAICAIAFEPVPSIYQRLSAQIQINNLDGKVILENAVIADEMLRKVPFFVPTHPWATSASLVADFKAVTKEIHVQSYTLDGYIQSRNVEQVDLIKIDVEGAEYKVLRGAQVTLQQHRPFIFCEILAQEPATLAEIEAILADSNYLAALVTPTGLQPQRKISPDLSRVHKNFLLWPQEKSDIIARLAHL